MPPQHAQTPQVTHLKHPKTSLSPMLRENTWLPRRSREYIFLMAVMHAAPWYVFNILYCHGINIYIVCIIDLRYTTSISRYDVNVRVLNRFGFVASECHLLPEIKVNKWRRTAMAGSSRSRKRRAKGLGLLGVRGWKGNQCKHMQTI